MKRGSISSYVAVAGMAATLSIAVSAWISAPLTAARAAESTGGNTALMTQPLPDVPGREVRITLLERAPLVASPAHHHPGHYTFGYVVEGDYAFGVNGQPPRILHAGDVFYEPPGAIHSTSANTSPDKKLKIVVFMVADRNNPSTVNEK